MIQTVHPGFCEMVKIEDVLSPQTTKTQVKIHNISMSVTNLKDHFRQNLD